MGDARGTFFLALSTIISGTGEGKLFICLLNSLDMLIRAISVVNFFLGWVLTQVSFSSCSVSLPSCVYSSNNYMVVNQCGVMMVLNCAEFFFQTKQFCHI